MTDAQRLLDLAEVTQEAREAAAELAEQLGSAIQLGGNDLAAIRNGFWDDAAHTDVLGKIVQAFARFEAEAHRKGFAEGKEAAASALMDYCRRMNEAGKRSSFVDALQAIRSLPDAPVDGVGEL